MDQGETSKTALSIGMAIVREGRRYPRKPVTITLTNVSSCLVTLLVEG